MIANWDWTSAIAGFVAGFPLAAIALITWHTVNFKRTWGAWPWQ